MLGGAISGGLGWEWVFAVNVPVGLAGAALAGRLLPESREPGAARLDVRGALTLTAGVGAVLLGLSRGEADGPSAATTLGPLAAGAGAARASSPRSSGARRRRCSRPAPCARRGSRAASFAALAITGATTPAMFLCVLHVQREGGVAPAEAGLLFAPFNLAVVAGSLAGPRVTARIGERARDGGRPRRRGRRGGAARASARPTSTALLAAFVLMGGGLGVRLGRLHRRGHAAAATGRASPPGCSTPPRSSAARLGLALLVAPAAAAGFAWGWAGAAAVAVAAALAIAGVRRPVAAARPRRSPG